MQQCNSKRVSIAAWLIYAVMNR